MWNTALVFGLDTHVHTMLSGHSWSSLAECVEQARLLGHRGLCVTEHSALLPNAPPEWMPESQVMLPRFYRGVRIYRGLEADILSMDGKLTPPEQYLKYLEFCIASIHGSEPGRSSTPQERTACYLAALENPYVDVLGHIDRTPCDMEAVVRAAKRLDKMLELNNQTMQRYLHGDMEASKRMLTLCKTHSVRVCVGTDAHFHTMIGEFGMALRALAEVDFPPELVLNYKFEEFDTYITARRKRLHVLD